LAGVTWMRHLAGVTWMSDLNEALIQVRHDSFKWDMTHWLIDMRHDAFVWESPPDVWPEWVTSHMTESCHVTRATDHIERVPWHDVWLEWVTSHMTELCHTWTSHVTRLCRCCWSHYWCATMCLLVAVLFVALLVRNNVSMLLLVALTMLWVALLVRNNVSVWRDSFMCDSMLWVALLLRNNVSASVCLVASVSVSVSRGVFVCMGLSISHNNTISKGLGFRV